MHALVPSTLHTYTKPRMLSAFCDGLHVRLHTVWWVLTGVMLLHVGPPPTPCNSQSVSAVLFWPKHATLDWACSGLCLLQAVGSV